MYCSIAFFYFSSLFFIIKEYMDLRLKLFLISIITFAVLMLLLTTKNNFETIETNRLNNINLTR